MIKALARAILRKEIESYQEAKAEAESKAHSLLEDRDSWMEKFKNLKGLKEIEWKAKFDALEKTQKTVIQRYDEQRWINAELMDRHTDIMITVPAPRKRLDERNRVQVTVRAMIDKKVLKLANQHPATPTIQVFALQVGKLLVEEINNLIDMVQADDIRNRQELDDDFGKI